MLPIPSELRYEPLPEAYGAALHKRRCTATESSLKGGGVAHIKVYPERNGYLIPADSTLNFTIQCSLTGKSLPLSALPNPNPGGVTDVAQNDDNLLLNPVGLGQCIRSIEVLNNGSTVEIINDYDKLNSMLFYADTDVSSLNSLSMTQRSTYDETRGVKLHGTRVVDYGPTTGQLSSNDGSQCTTPLITCSLPIHGMLSSKAPLPLGQLKHHLEIRITFVDTQPGLIDNILYTGKASGGATASTATIGISTCAMEVTNIYYSATIYRLEDSAEKEVADLNNYKNEKIKWSVESYRLAPLNYTAASFNSSTSFVNQLPAFRFNSLKWVLGAGFINNTFGAGHSGSSPIQPFDSVQWRLGGVNVPSAPLQSAPEMVVSTTSIFSDLSSSVPSTLFREQNSTINQRYNPVTTGSDTNSLRMVTGYTWEAFPNVEAISGINSTGMNCEFLATTANQVIQATRLLRYYHASSFDAVCVISTDGILSMAY